jgi:hypothetical protein
VESPDLKVFLLHIVLCRSPVIRKKKNNKLNKMSKGLSNIFAMLEGAMLILMTINCTIHCLPLTDDDLMDDNQNIRMLVMRDRFPSAYENTNRWSPWQQREPAAIISRERELEEFKPIQHHQHHNQQQRQIDAEWPQYKAPNHQQKIVIPINLLERLDDNRNNILDILRSSSASRREDDYLRQKQHKASNWAADSMKPNTCTDFLTDPFGEFMTRHGRPRIQPLRWG